MAIVFKQLDGTKGFNMPRDQMVSLTHPSVDERVQGTDRCDRAHKAKHLGLHAKYQFYLWLEKKPPQLNHTRPKLGGICCATFASCTNCVRVCCG